MRYGIEVVTLGELSHPSAVMRLAQAAEAAGWDGLFVWDHLAFTWGVPSGDPWVILSAVAACTSRLELGTSVAALPRYRPQVLAQMLVSLDELSAGRVIFGAGLGGVPEEFSAFGETGDAKVRAAKLEESLEIINRLWSGEAVTYQGLHYQIDGVSLGHGPVRQPRIPIWIGGDSRPALRRAARWDGWVIGGIDETGKVVRTPEQMKESIDLIRQHRSGYGIQDQPFDVAITGITTSPEENELPRAYESVGVTWWLESVYGLRGSLEDNLARIEPGPPR